MDFEETPPRRERDWLLDELATLAARVGPDPFLDAPILVPTRENFPDVWTPDEAGVERLARRLLGYAGLQGIEVEVTGGSAGPGEDEIWIEHCDDRTCRLGTQIDERSDPAGRMAIVAAAVYRRVSGLVPVDAEAMAGYRNPPELDKAAQTLEGKRAEITSIYLGFGVLTANYCYRHEYKLGRSQYVVTRPRRTLLMPQDFAYGLAVQAAVRRLGWWARHRLLGHLDINPAGFFRAAWRDLGGDADALAEHLVRPSAGGSPYRRSAG